MNRYLAIFLISAASVNADTFIGLASDGIELGYQFEKFEERIKLDLFVWNTEEFEYFVADESVQFGLLFKIGEIRKVDLRVGTNAEIEGNQLINRIYTYPSGGRDVEKDIFVGLAFPAYSFESKLNESLALCVSGRVAELKWKNGFDEIHEIMFSPFSGRLSLRLHF